MTESNQVAQQRALDQSFPGKKPFAQPPSTRSMQSVEDSAISQSFGNLSTTRVSATAQGYKPDTNDASFAENGSAL